MTWILETLVSKSRLLLFLVLVSQMVYRPASVFLSANISV